MPYLRRLSRTSAVQPSDEIRALWVVRDALTTPDDIDRCIDLAIQTRFHMLFVQVRGRADAYYDSSLEPAGADLHYAVSDFDPLRYALARAHAAGIEVHAWVNAYFVWSNGESEPPDGHVVNTHPDWLVTNADGVRADERPVDEWKSSGIEGYFVSPFSKPARDHIVHVVSDLIEHYDVDGIHLDYVRFPGADYGFGVGARTRFALEWGIDPADLRNDPAGVSAVIGAGAAASMDSLWTAERSRQVDSLVVALRGVSAGLALSAAVLPDPQKALVDKGQDWVGWAHRRWVDFVVPMAYNYRPSELLQWVQIVHNTIGRDRMLAGLAIYGGRDAFVGRSVNILRVDRVSGFAVFSYNVLADRRFPARFIEQLFFPLEPEDDAALPDSALVEEEE